MQGDVIEIVTIANDEIATVKNSKLVSVAEYSYDAWGVCTVVQNYANIATINPFRYRGYYYDEEIELYYLQSKYYDAGVGRFINCDEEEIVCLSPHNLYTYAFNNPVNETDSSGKIIQSLLFKIFAGVFCGFFIQFFDDVLEYLIQCIVKGRNNAKFGSDSKDYLSSIFSYTLQFVNPFGKSKIISSAISTFVPLTVKHGHILISHQRKASYLLIIDILWATMNFIAAYLLTWRQKNKISKIKKHSKTKKQNKNTENYNKKRLQSGRTKN